MEPHTCMTILSAVNLSRLEKALKKATQRMGTDADGIVCVGKWKVHF